MGGLIERSIEIEAVSGLLAGAAAGSGGSLLLAGPAGIGKSALLEHARTTALTRGFRVLSSTATPVSTGLSHAVVRHWLGPLVRERGPGARPFDGPGEDLATALSRPGTEEREWNLATVDYSLTWVLESLAEERPVLLTVDDVQWTDVVSLQLLDLLSARVHLGRFALLLCVRTGESTTAPDVVDRLAGRSQVLHPAPLTVAGVEALRRQVPAAPCWTTASAEEVHRLTGGVPFLLHELLRSGAPELPPRGVVESVRDRLDRLGSNAVDLARAVAVLDDDATFDSLAAMTGMSVADLADPLQTLVGSGILVAGLWRAAPAHPLVAEAVMTSMTPSLRSELHRRAADHLATLGRPRQVLASHLIHTLPNEDRSVVELLSAAGVESLRSGAPFVAARQLLRAAGETRPEDTSSELLALAASAHLAAGLRSEAAQLWEQALARAKSPEARARHLADLADMQMTLGERTIARRHYAEAVAVLTETGHDLSSPALRGLLARMGLASALYDGIRPEIVDAVEGARAQPRGMDTHSDRLLFAVGATDLAMRGEDYRSARDLALRALGDGALLQEESSDGVGFYVATAVLAWTDAPENLAVLEAAVEDARRSGSVPAFATASYCRGYVHFREGRLREALVDFDAALDMRARGWERYGDTAVAGAAMTHVGLGEHESARALESELRTAGARGGFVSAFPMAVAGIVRATHGDHVQALEDYARARDLMGRYCDNSSLVEWRELTAWSLLALGRRDEARAIAKEAVVLGRRWGAPRGLSFALRTLSHAVDRDEALPLLREAVALLADGGSDDYLARAQVDLATLLLDAPGEDRDEAVVLLRRALAFGRKADVPPAVHRARRALRRAGERVDEPGPSPLASLTPGERRVVMLAAAGDTNREIAHKLFVTVKAVEWHLSNAYRKLSVTSRAQLPDVLGAEEPSSSSDM